MFPLNETTLFLVLVKQGQRGIRRYFFHCAVPRAFGSQHRPFHGFGGEIDRHQRHRQWLRLLQAKAKAESANEKVPHVQYQNR